MLMEEAGKLKIYYGDESGFSLEPCIPYGWQPPGEYVRITPVGGHRLNVFGLLSRDTKQKMRRLIMDDYLVISG